MPAKQSVAYLDWSLDIECPNCGVDVDLVEYESSQGDYDIAVAIFSNNWDRLCGYDVECPHCRADFQIEKVEY